MESWCQWRTLATGRHIATPKVRYRINASDLCDVIRVANLQCERRTKSFWWSVPDCLTMAANGLNRARRNAQ